MHAHFEHELITIGEGDPLSRTASDFVAQIATNVWLGNLTDQAARVALRAYAMASDDAKSGPAHLWALLVREYLQCRERLDLCN